MSKSRIFMVIGVILLAGTYFFPLWNIELEAPQYPDPLGIYIYIQKLEGKTEDDLHNINILNHYVGMEHIPEHFPEFDIFPYVVAGMIGLGLIVMFIDKPWGYLGWLIVVGALFVAGLYDFNSWLYHYGHNIDPNAIMKFTDPVTGEPIAYKPPMFGERTILNFKASSYPQSGALMAALGYIFGFLAFYFKKKEK